MTIVYQEPSQDQLRFIVETAAAAPSVLNTQPWRFQVSPEAVAIFADTSRSLRGIDPYGRSLAISCGCALFTLRLAVRHLGREPVVRLLPQPADPLYLARVRINGPAKSDRLLDSLFAAIPKRHTNRGPFSPEQPPQALLRRLAESAALDGATLRVLPPEEATRVARLIHAGDLEAATDARAQADLREWVATDGDRADGIPVPSLGPRSVDPANLVRDFAYRRPIPGRPSARFEAATLAVLSTRRDERIDWLRAGQALQRALLEATLDGVSASFLNQPLEREDLRWLVRSPSGAIEYPQMIMRLGYGEDVPPTPRRPVEEVLAVGKPAERDGS